MARTKEFDTKEALAAATRVFWRHGYENTSLDMLLDGMRIGRQSLYDTFGDKRSLYLKALAHYRDETLADLRRTFAPDRSVKEGFAKLLNGIAAETPAQHRQGCLLLSANMERQAGDEVIAELLRGNQASVVGIFTEAILGAQLRREIPKGKDASALARFFVVTIQGMRAIARVSSDRKTLEQVAEVALRALD
jgi:TetR/AcrR family transcriptional repressor of nem operon